MPPPLKQLTYQPRPFDISAEADAALSKAVKEVAGTSRVGKQGAIADMLHVRAALNDFAGPRPWEIPPPSYTRVPQQEPRKLPDAMRETPGETVDQIARRLDPDTFRLYDKYAQQKGELRARVEAGKAAQIAAMDAKTRPLSQELAALQERAAKASKRNAKKIATRIAEVEGQIAAQRKAAETFTPDTEAAQSIQAIDVKMRDIAPAVSRAYTRAQKKWNVYSDQAAQIQRMIDEGRNTLPPAPPVDFDKVEADLMAPRTLGDKVPELASPLAKPVAKGTDAVDEVKRVNAELQKIEDQQLDAFREMYKVYDATLDAKPIRAGEGKAKPKSKAVEGEPETEISVAGFDRPLNVDEDTVMWQYDDGRTAELTVRELMEELNDSKRVMEAVTTCSVVKTSASV
jgi:DNA-binding FrmR family transcriptional regulator